LEQVADHIVHIKNVAGAEHVGFGGDFDGINVFAKGLEDVSKYPDLLIELAKRGFNDEELIGIMGGNIIRVLKKTELVAERMSIELSNPLIVNFNKTADCSF
jgi:membrane dipeptidase